MKRYQYIKDVLGVKEIFHPPSWNHLYQIYSHHPLKFQSTYLMFTYDSVGWDLPNCENKQLLVRIMNSLKQTSWSVVSVEKISLSLIQSLIFRSSANKIIFFGSRFEDVFSYFIKKKMISNSSLKNKDPFHQLFEFKLENKEKIRGTMTYSLEDFNHPSQSQQAMKKVMRVKAFEAFKTL